MNDLNFLSITGFTFGNIIFKNVLTIRSHEMLAYKKFGDFFDKEYYKF